MGGAVRVLPKRLRGGRFQHLFGAVAGHLPKPAGGRPCQLLGFAGQDRLQFGLDVDVFVELVDQVLAAMAAHDAHRLPLAPDIRYTEDGQQLALNDGFWGTASGQGVYKHYFLDPRTEQAAFFGVMKEDGTNNVIMAMRIKLEGRKVSEIETVFARTGLGTAGPNGAATLEAMGKPDPVWTDDNPDHATRDDIIRSANNSK